MNMIRINDVLFLAHLSNFSQLQQSLHSLSPSIPTLKGQSVVVSNYSARYMNLIDVVKEYSELLERDIEFMKQSANVLLEQDELIGNMLRGR